MGDTFGRVNENIANLSVREKALLIEENEHLFDRNVIFKGAKFLICIKETSFAGSATGAWDG
jgi:arsenate reductase-like glutaredoxin family protein